jgi:hypothetical protein
LIASAFVIVQRFDGVVHAMNGHGHSEWLTFDRLMFKSSGLVFSIDTARILVPPLGR